MGKRVAVLKQEADRLLEETLSTTKSVRNLKGRKDLGLYTWTPEPWDSNVDDTDRPYFFWVYEFYELSSNVVGGTKVITKDKVWIIVGTSPKSSVTVNHDDDLELEVFWEQFYGDVSKENLWLGMKKTKTRDLRSMELDDLEILAIMAEAKPTPKV